jgi:glutamate synthase (NADPH/NADH) large chain
MEAHLHHLRSMIIEHVRLTRSAWGETLLEDFRTFLPKFWLVKPKAAELGSLIESLRQAA